MWRANSRKNLDVRNIYGRTAERIKEFFKGNLALKDEVNGTHLKFESYANKVMDYFTVRVITSPKEMLITLQGTQNQS